MKSLKRLKIFLVLALCLSGCGVPKYATISSTPNLSQYKFVYITPTPEKTSVTGGTYGNQFGVFGSTSSKSVNPVEMITGAFIKQGFAILPEIDEGKKAQTIIVNYGEIGRKYYGIAYSIEATIQLLDASTYEVICTTSAEGMGETETDDVRKAIQKCLNAIFKL